MSRVFPGSGVSDYLETTIDVMGAVEPWTMFCWANPDATPIVGGIVGVFDSTVSNLWVVMRTDGTDDSLITEKRIGSLGTADTANSMTIAGWNSCFGIFRATNDRGSILNAGTEATNTLDLTGVVNNRQFRVGLFGGSSPGASFAGAIAWVTLWDIALGATEAAALNSGANPLTIAPGNILECWPLTDGLDPEPGVNGVDLSVFGTTTGPNPPVDQNVAVLKKATIGNIRT